MATPNPATPSAAPSPSSSSSSSSSLDALEGFSLLCRSSSGLQCVMVLKQVLKHPNIFVFGELFQIPSIQQLQQSEHKPWYELLKLFAYGSYQDYKSAIGLPELGPTELTKLKQLTIVQMATTQRRIPYSLLQSTLDISSLRALEDLIIECMNLGLIEGHLNQKDGALELTSAIGRDIGPKDVDEMINQLEQWLQSSDAVITSLKSQMAKVEADEAARKTESLLHDEKKKLVIEEMKANKLLDAVSPTSAGVGDLGTPSSARHQREQFGATRKSAVKSSFGGIFNSKRG